MIALSSEEKGWRRYFAPVSIVTVIITVGIFWYTYFYTVPKLSYEVLESYPLSDNEQITLIIFRNTGRSPATNIIINIESSGIIQNYILSSPEEINVITIAPNKLRFKMARLVHNVNVSIYIRTSMQLSSPFNEITMMSDQGTGIAYIIQKSLFPGYIEVGVLVVASITTMITFIALRRKVPERTRADNSLELENNISHSYARVNGTVTKTNGNDAEGSWRYEYNEYRHIYELEIQIVERRDLYFITRDLETLGSRSGFWEDEETFIHVAEMNESTGGNEYQVYVFACGNAETFEAAILPNTTENEEIYTSFLDLHTSELLDNVKNVIESSEGVISGETKNYHFERT